MRIEKRSEINWDPLLESKELDDSQKKRIEVLAEKLNRKSLGTVGSSFLSFCITKAKCNNDLILIKKPGAQHEFIIKKNDGKSVSAEIAPRNSVGATELYEAVKNFKSMEEIKKLLTEPTTDANLTDKDGWSPAYAAFNNLPVLDLLIQNGARVNVKNSDGSTPLIRAADNNAIDCVELLIASLARINHCNDVGTALTYATRKGLKEVVAVLLKHEADPNVVSDSLGKTPLQLAQEKGFTEIVELLKAAGAQEQAPQTELQQMVAKGGEALKKYLEDNPNKVDQYQRNAAHYWANNPSESTYDLLKEMGVRFDIKDHLQRLPIHYAAIQGHLKETEILFKEHPEIDPIDKHGYTPLFFAAQYDRLVIADFLVENGANINHKDKYGWSVLEKAAESSPRVCEYLCHRGADVSYQDTRGLTALHRAAIADNSQCIEILIRSKAPLNIQDNLGKTPSDYCKDEQCKQLFTMG